jgi:formylmethanofuran dehydrogenase subunit E
MVIGLRMGLLALERLNCRGWFDIRCHAALTLKPPCSCVIDGIQCSTGCTLGKHNIEVETSDEIKAEFTNGGKSIKVALRQEVFRSIQDGLAEGSDEDVRQLTDQIVSAPDAELFEIA